jgi:hypothetical protein
MDNDTLRKAIEITEAYLLLAPSAVLADDFRPALLQCLAELLGNLKPEASGVVHHLMQCVIRGAEGIGGADAVKIVVSDLISTGFHAIEQLPKNVRPHCNQILQLLQHETTAFDFQQACQRQNHELFVRQIANVFDMSEPLFQQPV